MAWKNECIRNQTVVDVWALIFYRHTRLLRHGNYIKFYIERNKLEALKALNLEFCFSEPRKP